MQRVGRCSFFLFHILFSFLDIPFFCVSMLPIDSMFAHYTFSEVEKESKKFFFQKGSALQLRKSRVVFLGDFYLCWCFTVFKTRKCSAARKKESGVSFPILLKWVWKLYRKCIFPLLFLLLSSLTPPPTCKYGKCGDVVTHKHYLE